MTITTCKTSLVCSAAFATAALRVTDNAHAFEGRSACRLSEINFTVGSYHRGDRGYDIPVSNPNHDPADPESKPYMRGFKHYQEINPGAVFGFNCPDLPAFFENPRIGYLAMNSFGRSATYIGFEHTLFDSRYARSTLTTALMPTGYKKPMPVIGVGVEGKGPFAWRGNGFEVRPYAMVSPIGFMTGKDPGLMIFVYGLKAVFDKTGSLDTTLTNGGGTLKLDWKPAEPQYDGRDGPYKVAPAKAVTAPTITAAASPS